MKQLSVSKVVDISEDKKSANKPANKIPRILKKKFTGHFKKESNERFLLYI